MKKSVSVIISLLVLFTCASVLTACRDNKNNGIGTNENNNVEAKNEVDNNTFAAESSEKKVDITDKSSYYFTINGQKFSTESMLKDIESAGLVQDTNVAQTEIQKGGYSLSGGFFRDSKTGNTVFSVIPVNNTEETVKCADATIGGFYLEDYYYKDYDGKIEINEGITIGSSLDELEAAFGKPTEKDMRENYENLGILYKYKVGLFQYFEFEIDKENHQIKNISWRYFQNQ
ncbi:MAG: hypothetical protein IJH12_02340 [Clostridia bacterium]|nr:hypothetical protein [Clostridia bacterium]